MTGSTPFRTPGIQVQMSQLLYNLASPTSSCLSYLSAHLNPERESLRFAGLTAMLFLLFAGILVAFALKYQRGDHSLGRDGPLVVVVGQDGARV